ncbi:DNA-binding MarR family transcriptional regulator [Pseudomonas frederiksbergensis]|uniref:MarR family winged helix-turn-helix transcriptional regulator n=1 Tax=Pseudomonas frederiksbergensis TaxID=104087 RepID=UPI003D1DAA66
MNKIPGNTTATPDAPQDRIEAKTAFENLVCTNTALRLAARRLGNLYDEALAPVGLKATQVSLLTETTRMAAANEGRAPTLQDLAAKLAIQISALTHALKPLIRDGLVELRADEQDRRTKRAVLTPAGTELLHKAIVHWSTANQRVEEVLGVESAASLRAVADYVASDEFLSAYLGE